MATPNNTGAGPCAAACKRLCLIGLALLAAACQQSMSLKVASEVPVPLMTQLPLSLGVFYDEQLRNYVYEEDSEERSNWNIDSGASHVALFARILPAMFREVTEVAGSPTGSPVDAVLVPKVAEMQFALPQETKTDFYEAWIKYEMTLQDPQGERIAAWLVTGYGKSSTEFMKSRDKGLNAAVNQALRDAGARFALGFPRVAAVKTWLADQTGDSQPSPTDRPQ